jgi:predicted acylesterase/phospholipase RssA
MYGGVSLAIYINGVAHELFRAVRGRGMYRLVKALTDSDVVVDVLSGSSTGGINGILLSYALCSQCEFSSTAELWRKNGDIDVLLNSVTPACRMPTIAFERWMPRRIHSRCSRACVATTC